MSESVTVPALTPTVAEPPRRARQAPGPATSRSRVWRDALASPVVFGVTAALFVALFAKPMQLLALDWWNNPEAGHGLLLAPLAFWLAYRQGVLDDARPNVRLGLLISLAGD